MFNKRSADWILDVKRHLKFRDRFIVLTSTRFIVMSVTPASNDALDGGIGEAGATILLAWRHYRSAEDFTLQMSVQMMSEDGKLQGQRWVEGPTDEEQSHA
jgi:RNA polymerase I-specific transcription initiation factor RRN6